MIYNTNPPVSLPEICIARSELMQIYNNAAKKQIIYVHAPGGYGKTISAMLWIEMAKRMSVWHLFDEYDNTLIQFYRVLCISLLSLIPKNSNEEFLNIIYSSAFNDAPVESAVDFLTRGVFGKEKLIFVMDDFHTITNSEIKRTLPYILKRIPANITVCILSRNEIPNQFEMIHNAGKISEIGFRELVFSKEEIRNYFAGHRLSITEAESKSILSYTGGQIILLNIMARNSIINKDSDDFKRVFNNFYEKSIWNSIDESAKEFLLKTSVFNKFTLELCEVFTGKKNSKDILDILIQKNVNLSCFKGEYSHNQIFLDFIREKIRENNIEVIDTYKSAVDYYIQKDNFIEVYRYAVESGNSFLIEKSTLLFLQSNNVDFDKYTNLSKSINFIDVPESVYDKIPAVYFSKAVFCFLTGDVKGYEYNTDKLKANLDIIMDEYPQWVNFILSYTIMDCRIGIFEYIDFINRSASETDKFSMTVSRTGGLQLPFLHKGVRDLYEAARTDAGIIKIPSHILGNFICGIKAGLYIEQNRIDEANDALLHDESLLNNCKSITTGFGVYIMLAETALIKNNREKFEEYKSLAKAFFENHHAFCFRKNFLAYEIRTKLWDGNTEAAKEWLDNYAAKDLELGYVYKIFQNFTTARSYIVLKESSKALSTLKKIKSVAQDFDRLSDAAEADVLISLTEWNMGKKNEACERLFRVLDALYPYHYIRVIANEGKAILPVIKSILKKADEKHILPNHSMFKQYIKKVYIAAYEQSKHFKGLTCSWENKPVKLSPQQTLILELLAKGHSNNEITEIMKININTVKSYTAIAYRKLGVNNAMDAISRATQIGLLK